MTQAQAEAGALYIRDPDRRSVLDQVMLALASALSAIGEIDQGKTR
jgi:hypothetical protein